MAVKLIPFLSVLALMLFTAQASADDERSMFMDAKKKCISQDWRTAINLLEQYLEKYPDSRNADDAKFWIGY